MIEYKKLNRNRILKA